MSKVKISDIDKHAKEKMRHKLRRSETAHVKNKRIKNWGKIINNKFYVKDERPIYERKTTVVPEHQEFIETYHMIECYHINEDGSIETWPDWIVRKKLVTIPEQTHTRSYYRGEQNIEPYVKQRSRGSKKYLRKIANRKARHTKGKYNHADYKRLYDLWWAYD